MRKRLDAMRDNPEAGWTIADVVAVCREAGVDCTAARAAARTSIAYPDPDDPLKAPDQADIHPSSSSRS